MREKKVLIITALAGFINSFLLYDIELYKKLGYKVYCAANNNFYEGEDVLKYLEPLDVGFFNIEFYSKNPFAKNNISAYKKLKKVVEENNFDVVHCHTPIVAVFTRMICKKYRKKGLKVIYTSHGLSYNFYSSWKTKKVYRLIEKYFSKYTDGIICINEEDYNEFIKMKCKKVYKINGVGSDINRYSNVNIDTNIYKEKLGIPLNKKVVLSIGELSKRKNHQIIIRALSMLNKDEYVYVICGREILRGGTLKELKDLSANLGVNVLFLGQRSDIPEILHCADICAMPSIREGLGMAGIESLAAGVPIVGSDVQGIKDYVINGKTGYVCGPFEVESFAKNIDRLSTEICIKDYSIECMKIVKKFDCLVCNEQLKKAILDIL